MRPKTGVVLVNWNTADLTVACLDSVRGGTLVPDEMVVVDNASVDGSVGQIAKRCADVLLLRNENNTGFAAASNRGIRRLVQAGCEIVWILNNDTRVDPTCFERLVTVLRESPRFGAVGGQILMSSDPSITEYGGADWDRLVFRPRVLSGRIPPDPESGPVTTTECLSGCCMLVRTSVMEKVGLFCEQFFAYYEDTEWSLRARMAGITLGYCPGAKVRHEGSASVRKNEKMRPHEHLSPLLAYLSARNHLLLIRKHARRPWPFAPAMIRSIAVSFLYAFLFLGAGRFAKSRRMLAGVADGLRTGLLPPPGIEPR
jgi:GT2 family glycosyltransferase